MVNIHGNMWSGVVLSLMSGVLLTAGFPRLEMPYLSWIALIPLLWALRNRTGREAFTLGFLCGLAHYLTALYWIWTAVHRFGGVPVAAAAAVLLLLCLYLALYPAVFALAAWHWEPHPFLRTLLLPGIWVALELVRAYLITGFPWASLGYSQTPLLTLIQVADLGGVYLVSWLVVFGNTALLAVIEGNRRRTSAVLLSACLIGCWWYGEWRKESVIRLQGAAPSWTVGVVQGNIDQSQKWDPAFQQETLARYRRLSLAAAQEQPDLELIIWPETAAPFFYGLEPNLTVQLNEIIQETGVPLLFGSPGAVLVGGETQLQNRAYLVDETGVLESYYAKQHLVPFGEYVPLKKFLFFVDRLVQAAGDFVPGEDPSPLVLRQNPFGVLICYEDIFPDLARLAAERGARALVNLTNDAWYGHSSAPYQHLAMARWRAVEFRVPLIRAANTGISAVTDATGRLLGTVPFGEEGFLVATVQPLRSESFYKQWGDVFAWLCVWTSLVGLGYGYIKAGTPKSATRRTSK